MAEISVIIPIYKVEKYLQECLDSVINQTFSDLQIVLVDDGSPDGCGAICDKYAETDDRIVVIHQENSGLSNARNAGIAKAVGKYICFIDSDDIVSLEYCKTLYNLLADTEYDFSVCGVCRYKDGENPVPGGISNVHVVSNVDFFGMQVHKQSEFGVWNKLYRRELFEHIKFRSGKIHEDVFWSCDLARVLSHKVIFTEKQLYYYRIRGSGIVAEHAKKCSSDRVAAGKCLIETAEILRPELVTDCVCYTLGYPWSFIDKIYVNNDFNENSKFMKDLREAIRGYGEQYYSSGRCSAITEFRMKLYSYSPALYGINAYSRLMRNYIYRLFGKDPYSDGHGI